MSEMARDPLPLPQRRAGLSRVAFRIAAALWFGSSAFLLGVAAPAAFRASDSPTNAANVVGAMLGVWHYLGLALPLFLLLVGWKRARAWVTAALFGAVVLAAVESGIDLRIRAIRNASSVAISSLPRESPERRHFGMLHGISSLLLLGQAVVAAVTVGVGDD